EIPKVETRGYPTMTKLEGLSKNDLVKQLKAEFQKLSDVNQEKCDLQEWEELAASLGTRQIMKHKDKDVRLYAACCLADIMRIFAPNAPYDTNLQSDILYLWIEQLRGLYNPNSQTFRRHYYILESLAYVQTFNVAIYMEAYDAIIDLFRLFFEIIRQLQILFLDEHNLKVVNCMTMIMSSLVIDSEVIPQKLLDTILIQIIEPNKSQNKASYNLASQLITKTATSLEPYVQVFFTNCMTSEKASESEVSDRLYDIIYQLNSIAPSVLISVLPQLEYKLKSNEADERLDVTRLLARMFSDPESAVAKADSPLWKLLIGRFIDINASVRIECIRYAKYFLVYHPHFAKDTIEKLIVRSRDTDDKVRLEVVKIISEIAIEKLEAVTEELWDALKERMRDKKWIVRKEAMIKIAALYKSFKTKNEKNKYHKELQWMPNKLLHCYYQPGIEDRIFVEKIFRTALIPCNLKANDKILQLLNLQKVLDDHALRALNEIFRSKAIMRKHMMEFIQLVDKAKLEPDNEDMEPKTLAKKMVLSKMFPDSSKAHDQFRYIADSLYDQFFCNTFKKCFDPKTDCEKTLQAEVDILKDLSSRRISPEWMQILFDRCTSVTFDSATVQFLVKQIPKIAKSMSADDQQKLAQNDSGSNEFSRCTQMLQSVSILMPTLFTSKSCQEEILQMLESQMISIVDLALRVLVNCAKEIKIDECPVKSFFQPKLIKFATNGTPAQAKLSMKCIATLCKDSVVIMERIHGTLLKSLQVESKMLLTTLTSLAQIATFAPGVFEKNSLEIVREFVVKKIVTVDGVKDKSLEGKTWCEVTELQKMTRAKLIGLKVIIKWLNGLQANHETCSKPVFNLIKRLLQNRGDIKGSDTTSACERAHMRLVAACCMIKIAQNVNYASLIDSELYALITWTMQDDCREVKKTFCRKLHKYLQTLKLGSDYVALLAFGSSDGQISDLCKQVLQKNVHLRREFMLRHKSVSVAITPEYATFYLIYLLAHHPDFDPDQHSSLKMVEKHLWFYLDAVLSQAEHYSYIKQLVESIKLAKDASNLDNVSMNRKIYTVCDVALACIAFKARTMIIKPYRGQIALPKKLFAPCEQGFVNTHQYLPANFAVTPNKKRIVRGSPTKKVATTPKKSSASESNTPLKRKLISTPKSSFDFNNTSDDSDNDLNHSVRSPPKKVNVSSTPAAKPRKSRKGPSIKNTNPSKLEQPTKTKTRPKRARRGRKAVEKMAEEFGSEGSNENRESSSDIVSPDSEEELASSISRPTKTKRSNDETSDDEDQKVSHSRRRSPRKKQRTASPSRSATSPKKKLKSDKRKPSKQSKSKVESKSVSKRRGLRGDKMGEDKQSTNVTESIKVEKSPTQAGTESSGKTQNQKSHINEDTARRARGRRKKEITDVDDKGKVEAKQPEKKSDRTSRSKQSSKKKDAVAVEKEHAIALDTHKSDSPLNIQSKKETSLRKGAAEKADGKVVSKPSQKERSSRSQSRQSTTRKASNTSKAKEESISTVTKRGSAASRSRKKIEKKKVNEPVAKKESLTETKEDTAKMEDSDDSDSSDYVEASSKMKTTEKKSKSAAKSSKATPKTVPRRKATTKKADKQQKLFKGNPPRNVGCASCS
ncbi:Sister chromatid cohesion protein PDS5-like protein B-B, partial [Trichoplax sp. H2]